MTKTRRAGFSKKRRRGGRKTVKRRAGRRRSRGTKRRGGVLIALLGAQMNKMIAHDRARRAKSADATKYGWQTATQYGSA